MGKAKQDWMERLEAEARTAHWDCPVCNTVNESEFDIPDVNFISDDASDYWGEEELTFECVNCDFKSEGTVYYSVGGLEFTVEAPDGNPIAVEAPDPRDYNDDNYGDWYWVPTKDPFDVYRVSREGMKLLLNTSVPIEHDEQLLNRVVFAQTITAIETFLSDIVIHLVKDDIEVQKRIYEKHPVLSKRKFTAVEVLEDHLLLEKQMLKYFREDVSFHNFPKVNQLFKYALNKEIFVDDNIRSLMMKAMKLRHDCVHRNGKTLEGIIHDCFDKQYVMSILDASLNFVTHVNSLVFNREFAIYSKKTDSGF